MSEGKRPGGLTALAVINFVFGGFNCLIALGMVVLIAVVSGAVELDDEAQRGMAEAWREVGAGLFYVLTAATVVSAFLLISSGVGYLKQSKFWGRTLGNVYAIVSIASSLVSVAMVPEAADGGFNLGTIINLVYPVLTVILLNTTFKEDFVR